MNRQMNPIRIIDSHTAGEPTRVIIGGGPSLGGGSMRERLIRFQETADHYRRLAINEPRGSAALVGAVLCQPEDPSCAAGVIFFNNTGYLGMCGHGAIGVAVTLAYMGRIGIGVYSLETPVGRVEVDVLNQNTVAIENVTSYRFRPRVSLNVESMGTVTGDIAWGGNWFFLIEHSPIPVIPENIRKLSDVAERVRAELKRSRITGANGEEIDHVEFFGPALSAGADSRNFVYCPGGEYDRSPCGTGTSAKLACLAEDEKLLPGDLWVQESIIGSRFTASYRRGPSGQILPRVKGEAYICAETSLILEPDDPFPYGIQIREPK